jgi:2',3'-cyclic-nucleotide 2'-phosphodiesterase (5'-nucleotidase family)
MYAPGSDITRRDVLAELPFGNRLVTIEISGRDLRRALENGVSQLPQSSGRFPQVSGIAIEVDHARPPGDRITAMRVAGAPLDPDRTYRVATNDFLARGSDGYVTFGTARRPLAATDAPPLANEVMVYLRNIGRVQTGIENRIVVR